MGAKNNKQCVNYWKSLHNLQLQIPFLDEDITDIRDSYNTTARSRQRTTRIYKNIILYFYSSMVTPVWSWRAIWESLYKRVVRSQNSQQELTSAKILDLIESQNSHATHMAMSLHWCNACFSLAIVYIHTMLVFN